ncbi:monooxygenase FAD-binding [Catenulispora acidiphila DSM 44928]|uniref:Monooxygenase FAD-binding n=1 Tax=Catenulispora acidiphila (strain DSM 44928 / JCM 14897 / NBRC 102108 / NRRL B-24433 / ID139908) TaxID=479433 RepID=C7QJY1_CATAD|nr:flavin-dependent oxidoreductase [Catenulispora acidiphila]ACU73219.1 monooxygenase FAD-binding [Catenulispora acidiphila DSM 44928]
MRILIVGAGIGGLSTALSLHAAWVGADIRVIDSVSELRPLGVGINLLPHATRELIELGLGPELARMAVPTAEVIVMDRFGNRIWSEARGRGAGYNWPQYSVHRGELQTMLAEAVRDRLGAGSVQTSTSLAELRQNGDRVLSRLVGRDGRDMGTVESDIVIGADGLHSTVRAQLHPEEGAARWSGVMMWRGCVEGEAFLGGKTMMWAGSNRAAKFVVYPVSPPRGESGRVLINWVAEVRVDDAAAQPPDWNRAGDLADVLPHFEGWTMAGVDVCGLMAATPKVLEYPMVDRDPLPFWGRGRVTLVGDAAHPMYPIGSNGGSQAILDARHLAHLLAQHEGDPGAGLAAYEEVRRPATAAVVAANRRFPMDRILNVVAERAPEGFGEIGEVLSEAEIKEIDEAFRSTTGFDADALNARASLSVR